ncbi:MAG: DUF1926 domain-containing protein, partial [Treponema sp.]|nr:DUF1926 domain-containing protein [Treponema sp.]
PSSKNEFLPLIVNEQGKNIKILSLNRQIEPAVFDETSPESYVSGILKTVKKTVSKSSASGNERVICINIGEDLFKHLFNSGWVEDFYKCLERNFSSAARLMLPGEYIHTAQDFIPAYIPAGIRSDIAQWAKNPYTCEKLSPGSAVTIHDFLMTYSQNQKLYNRMLYVSMLAGQAHGDKMRRKEAREKLWCAQSGEAYVCTPDGIFVNNSIRQRCYKILTETEKLLRTCNPKDRDFEESVVSYDYNNDGHDEYICRMKNYTACITLRGGQINELDIMQNSGNYADNLNRIEKYDKVDDGYERGLFVEHLFTESDYKDYKRGLPSGNGIFSTTNFTQMNFDAKHHEIKLLGTGEFSSMDLPVSLRKKYIASSNGFTVQMILKNESPLPLKGVIAVESNFAQTDFSTTDKNSYKTEIITTGESHEIEVTKKTSVSKSVSYLKLTDTSNDVSFVFEPNEDCECVCRLLAFNRPVLGGSGTGVSGNTLVSALCWNVNLAPGMEMEKNISFSILTPKKKAASSKRPPQPE